MKEMLSRPLPEPGSRVAVAREVLATLPPRSGLLVDLGGGPGALLERTSGARLGIDRSRADSPRAFLEEISRVVRTGGHLAVGRRR